MQSLHDSEIKRAGLLLWACMRCRREALGELHPLGGARYLLAEDAFGAGRLEVAFLRRQPGGLVDGGCPRVSDVPSRRICRSAASLWWSCRWAGGERLDTRNPTSKLMLTILAGVATWEREIMLERQREGIAKAKAAGKYKGRPVSIDAAQIRQLRAELGPAAIAKRLGIARSSVYRVLGA